jgi:hypothetical protein
MTAALDVDTWSDVLAVPDEIRQYERITLGMAMQSMANLDAIRECIEPFDFCADHDRAILRNLCDHADQGKPFHPTAICETLIKADVRLPHHGYIVELFQLGSRSAGDPAWYAKRVAEAAEGRYWIKLATNIRQAVTTGNLDVARDVARTAKIFADLSESDDNDHGPVFVDTAAILRGGLPEPPEPTLLRRDDGHRLFYDGKVNVLFGDPECGKTWIALAAVAEALNDGKRAAMLDMDHNGAQEVLARLLALGAKPDALADPDGFRLSEPDDVMVLGMAIQQLREWRPDVVVVDSIGEMLPMFGLSSNSPDDYTAGHRRALTPLALAGAAVIAIDHMPKGEDARTHGQTGTIAKKRAVNGSNLKVTVVEVFAPGKGGAASMTVFKDRPGGLRKHCPVDGKSQPAGRFVMAPREDGSVSWRVTSPSGAAGKVAADPRVSEIAARLDAERVPSSYGRDRLRTECERLDIKAGNDLLAEVAKLRKGGAIK